MEREGRRQGEGPGPHQCSSSLKESGSDRLAPGLHAATRTAWQQPASGPPVPEAAWRACGSAVLCFLLDSYSEQLFQEHVWPLPIILAAT